jgi:hypothetical protein
VFTAWYEMSLYIQFRLIFVFKELHRSIVEIVTAMQTILPWSRSGCHTAPPEGARSPSFSSTHHNSNSATDCNHFDRLVSLGGEGGCVAHVTASTLEVTINRYSRSVSWMHAHLAFKVSCFVLRDCWSQKSRSRGRTASLISALSWFPHILQEMTG